jgi:hypothetical protein
MRSKRLAGKRGLSKALASTTHLDGSAHRVKPPIPPPPAARSLSPIARAKLSAAKSAKARSRHTSMPRDTLSACRSRGSQARFAVAELDPSELLQLEGADCIAEPARESYGAPAAKGTSGK